MYIDNVLKDQQLYKKGNNNFNDYYRGNALWLISYDNIDL